MAPKKPAEKSGKEIFKILTQFMHQMYFETCFKQ